MNRSTEDYNSISPSAEYLMKLKAYTKIPFARSAANLVLHDTAQAETGNETSRAFFFRMLIHFETRYWTVEKLLRQANPQNILEISSGYSFRGIDWCFRHAVHFIDTDLPDLVASKNTLVQQLAAGRAGEMKGHFELMPLNVMDEPAFMAIVRRFPKGPLTIVNEGLLVYLGVEEKKRLCATIRRVLMERGGQWITGDIYTKRDAEEELPRTEQMNEFRKKHQLHENSFEDFESAERFFYDCGLEVTGREAQAIEDLSCLELVGPQKEAIIKKLESNPSTRESWCLRPRL